MAHPVSRGGLGQVVSVFPRAAWGLIPGIFFRQTSIVGWLFHRLGLAPGLPGTAAPYEHPQNRFRCFRWPFLFGPRGPKQSPGGFLADRPSPRGEGKTSIASRKLPHRDRPCWAMACANAGWPAETASNVYRRGLNFPSPVFFGFSAFRAHPGRSPNAPRSAPAMPLRWVRSWISEHLSAGAPAPMITGFRRPGNRVLYSRPCSVRGGSFALWLRRRLRRRDFRAEPIPTKAAWPGSLA